MLKDIHSGHLGIVVVFKIGYSDPHGDITVNAHNTKMSKMTHCIIITESKCYST